MNSNDDQKEGIPTLQLALDSMTADELRKLVALTGQKVPRRRGDMAALIVQHFMVERLRTAWETLDELHGAAVAEAVHSPSSQLNGRLFRAKYGRDPDWAQLTSFFTTPSQRASAFSSEEEIQHVRTERTVCLQAI